MTLSRRRRADIIVRSVLAVWALGSTAAGAQTVTRFAVYMHSGPGFEFAVTDEIPNRTPLTPETCTGGWCRVNYSGVYGWVPQKMLVTEPSTAEPQPGQRPTECMDFARTGWPNSGDLERVCIFAPNKAIGLDKPAG